MIDEWFSAEGPPSVSEEVVEILESIARCPDGTELPDGEIGERGRTVEETVALALDYHGI